MNIRKIKRSRKKTSAKKTDRIISAKAEKTANAAVQGEASIDCVGNFIFFSTTTGEAWMLDHRKSYALRLADNFHLLPYGINESKDRFQIEWKERYRLEGDTFIASCKGEESRYDNYPVDAIAGLTNMIKQKEKGKISPRR